MTPLPVIPFTNEEITGCTNEVAIGLNKEQGIHLLVFYFMFYCFSNSIN